MTCTLLGEVKQFAVVHNNTVANEGEPGFEVQEKWRTHAQKLAKVNTMAITGDRMAIGGLTEDGKGVVEMWDVSKDAVERMETLTTSTVSQDHSTQ